MQIWVFKLEPALSPIVQKLEKKEMSLIPFQIVLATCQQKIYSNYSLNYFPKGSIAIYQSNCTLQEILFLKKKDKSLFVHVESKDNNTEKFKMLS